VAAGYMLGMDGSKWNKVVHKRHSRAYSNHAMLFADEATCLWLHRVQIKIRWDVMKILTYKIFISFNGEIFAGRIIEDDTSSGSVSDI
jgi:hypothetical protein